MTAYYDLINFLKETFESDADVQSVVTGDWEEWAQDEFPLVHIDVESSQFIASSNISRFTVNISVASIRDFNNEDVKDKFWHNDNRHDNWNKTHKILKEAYLKIAKDNGNVTIADFNEAQILTWAYMNGLDGWQQTWIIDVDDFNTSAC